MAEKGLWREIGGLETNCGASDFLSGVDVWVKRPQVVNRRLLGAVVIEGGVAERERRNRQRQGDRVVEEDVLVRELLPRAKSVAPRREVVSTQRDLFLTSVTFDPQGGCESDRHGSYMLQHCIGSPNRITLSIHRSVERVTTTTRASDSELSRSCDTGGGVRVKPCEGRVELCSTPDGSGVISTRPNGVTTPTSEWLYSVLLPKVVQWAEECGGGEVARQQPLVPLGKYCSLYRELKEKYGPPLIKDWPEATDPQKFVYEDIAIATYLILLWEEERKDLALTEKQTFVDLGCGNGLLVYLLSSEGHRGKGIDLRERKIWRYYGNRADLEVCSLTPSDVTVFPEFDWLIGNHSDELTPWIPLIAARSSYHTRYFVLPCCPHDFDSKFRRPDTTKSQYGGYLDYIRQIGETVGFCVEEDTLRIPSSKRVCHIGRKRWYSAHEEEEIEAARQSFLRERCRQGRGGGVGRRRKKVKVEPREDRVESDNVRDRGQIAEDVERNCHAARGGVNDLEGGSSSKVGDRVTLSEQVEVPSECGSLMKIDRATPYSSCESSARGGGRGGAWSESFVPRSSTEQTRNCANVDRDLQQFIVKTLAGVLLETENWINIEKHSSKALIKNSSTPTELSSGMCVSTPSASGRGCKECVDSDANRAAECERGGGGKLGRGGGKGDRPNGTATRGNGEASSPDEAEGSPEWNLGGRMRVNEAVLLFDCHVLRHLKQECGGLQTLLRNHHQVFCVSGGFVQLRNWADTSQRGPRKPPKPRSVKDAKRLVKTKLCWFHQHHPQGCPRSLEACQYAHGQEELRDRPDFNVAPVAQFSVLRT